MIEIYYTLSVTWDGEAPGHYGPRMPRKAKDEIRRVGLKHPTQRTAEAAALGLSELEGVRHVDLACVTKYARFQKGRSVA